MDNRSFAPPDPPTVQVVAALEPVRNVLVSLWALTAGDDVRADEWSAQHAARLTPEQRDANRVLFAAPDVLLDDLACPDFPSYLAALAARPAVLPHVVTHLRTLWETLLAAEWQRQAPLLAKSTRSIEELVFSQPQWQAMPAIAALRMLLQTEPEDAQVLQLAGVRRIVLAWSPHVAAFCNRFGSADTLWVFRSFEPQLLRRDPLRRAEVLKPLEALADDTRLRILELLADLGEQRAQELIPQLESSQGNVSRHLKQLVGTGFVRERRAGDANKRYAVDANGLPRLFFLLRQLLSPANVAASTQERRKEQQLSQVRAGTPPALHGLLDSEGRITRWSSKLKDQAAMLEYLVAKFEPEHSYSEKEVNDLLRRWYLDADFVLVRRSLIDAGLLQRTRDGTRYWRAA